MKQRVRCPFHHEKTASLVRRKHDWYCYGACHKPYTIKEVEERGIACEYDDSEDYKEDLNQTLSYIKALPNKEIRGLRLPYDSSGYYVVWSDNSFYKRRNLSPGKGTKYIGPKGHTPPLFWANRRGEGCLYVVEGELNALSLWHSLGPTAPLSVCSPGSASCFGAETLAKYLTEFKKYSKIIVILDDDAAGTKGLIEAKAFLLYKVPFLSFAQVKPDFNELLVEGGREAVLEALQRADYK